MLPIMVSSAIMAMVSLAGAMSVPPTGNELAVRETTTLVLYPTPQNITRFTAPVTERGLSVPAPALDKRASEAIVTALIAQSGVIATAACAIGTSTGIGAGVCIAAIAYAALVGIWAAFYNGAAKRNIDLAFETLDMAPAFKPTSACNAKCQLEASTPEGVWTAYANVTVNDMPHSLHFYHNGTLRGVKAVQHSIADVSKRQVYIIEEYEEDGNFEGSIYWEDGAETA